MSEEPEEVTCAVVACPNNYTSENSHQNREDLTYHRFPKDSTMKAAWLKACMRPKNWDKADFAYVCSDHFDPTDFNYPDPGSHEVYLSSEAIPSTRIKFSIKAEPIDVEDECQELLNQEGLEIVMGAEDEQDCKDMLTMDQDDSQLVYDQSDSIFLNDLDADRRTCTKCAREFKTEVG
uniref:THAP-type domain-containing protein n=1 Tax=Lygus hesperus TaxID=30085 RepID=A0A0K8T2B7_LYGHE